MASIDFDFQRYVERQKDPHGVRSTDHPEFGDYAFSGDLRVLRQLKRIAPVRVVAESTVRFWRTVQRNKLLGESTKITPKNHTRLYELTAKCARTLDIVMPTVYVSSSGALNAGTYGTDDDAFILLNAGLLNMLDDDEITFVIGHECGHLQNNHVVYRTAVLFMTQGIVNYLKWAVGPATLALHSWSRRGEITCDRAGLLCCGSEEVALRTMFKVHLRSNKEMDPGAIDDYLDEQLEASRAGIGRLQELMSTHPWMPKRIRALQLFAKSNYYRSFIGERGGDPLDQVDREVEELLRII